MLVLPPNAPNRACALLPGIAGPNAFICVRCIVLAERMLDEGVPKLFHLTRETDQSCSFCGQEHTQQSAMADQTNICRDCTNVLTTALS